MKLIPLLLELDYRTFEAMVQIQYGEEGPKGYDDAIRALPGVTTVTLASEDDESKLARYKIKIISQKEPLEAFSAFKANGKAKYTDMVAIKVGEETIEEK